MFYAGQLKCKYSHSSMHSILKVAYNDFYRILHGLPRNTSARELQTQDNNVTFDALLRKSIFRFIDRCRKSDNLLIRYTVNSDYFLTSEYFHHCNQLLTKSDSNDWILQGYNKEMH